jgi:hypothetical protein
MKLFAQPSFKYMIDSMNIVSAIFKKKRAVVLAKSVTLSAGTCSKHL